MTHLHITTWVLALLLVFVGHSMYKSGAKAATPVHMVLRLVYLAIIGSGAYLFMTVTNIPGMYHLKATLGILAIGCMEMVLVRTKKGKSTNVIWIVFALILLGTIYVGLQQPQGFHLFG